MATWLATPWRHPRATMATRLRYASHPLPLRAGARVSSRSFKSRRPAPSSYPPHYSRLLHVPRAYKIVHTGCYFACSAVSSRSAPARVPEMGSLSALPLLRYPPARRDDAVVDDYQGVQVRDPYRWLEDPDGEETREFVAAQCALTEGVLGVCGERESLRGQITKLLDHPRYDTPFKRGGKYFYYHNTGLQPQSVLYVQEDLDGEAEVLLDPNGLSEDGTVALSALSVSEDGRYLAYGLSSSGSDWVTIKVMRMEDKKLEPDTISWVKFSSISWTHDGKGFFYGRYPAPKEGELDAGTETNINLNHELYYHVLGTDQSEDILCWRDPEHPKYLFDTRITDDGKYLLLHIEEGCDPVNKLYYCNLSSLPQGLEDFKRSKDMLPFVKLVDNFEARYEAVANDDTEFLFLTNKDAPKYKLVRVDLKEPELWADVLPEDEKDVLESAYAVNGNQLLVSYLSDVKHVLQIRDMKTGLLLHPLPLDIGSVTGISGRRKDSEVFFGFTSFLTPAIIYKCNLATEVPEMKIFREISVSGFSRADFEVKQVFISSKDGTEIPMFIVSKKDIILDGSHPTLLYGYGGFNINLTPSFNVSRIVLAKNLGVIFCVANIRGGGEYGEEWHKAGSLSNKQNCFDDFISAAQFLVSAGYTNPKKLCIEGGSNGGLLVAACINQRPDLFGCALAHVGVMDMLRFHKFTIGHAWTSDYGCSDNEEEFHWLIKYSPLHNVRRPWEKHNGQSCQYPSTMLLTADHDDRVVPLHSLKLLATNGYNIDWPSIKATSRGQAYLQGFLDVEAVARFRGRLEGVKDMGEADAAENEWSSGGWASWEFTLKKFTKESTYWPASIRFAQNRPKTMQYVLCTSVENSPQTNPIIARIDCKAGHGAGRPTQKMIDEAADRYSFMAKMLEATWID